MKCFLCAKHFTGKISFSLLTKGHSIIPLSQKRKARHREGKSLAKATEQLEGGAGGWGCGAWILLFSSPGYR